MKITPNNLFHTPKSFDELVGWLERLPADCRIAATTAALMAWNLAAGITNGEIKPEKDQKAT